MIGFVIVAALAAVALLYVSTPARRRAKDVPAGRHHHIEAARERKRLALVGILDMEEEHQAGKLDRPAYLDLRARYEREALDALRQLEGIQQGSDAELEAEISRLKETLICNRCGERRGLGPTCDACGAP